MTAAEGQQQQRWTHDLLRERYAQLDASPAAAHVAVTAGELARIVRPILDELPDARAYLVQLPAWKRWTAIAASIGSVLRHPVAITGGIYDAGHNVAAARGNGWAQLTAAIIGERSQRARTAARHWADVPAGAAVRVPRFNAPKGARDRWTAPARRRKDGSPRPSAGREYARHFVQSEAYFAAAELRAFYASTALAGLRRCLGRVIPDRWRAAVVLMGWRSPRVGYWHRIRRSRRDVRAWRIDREKRAIRERIIAYYRRAKRSERSGRPPKRPTISGGEPKRSAPFGPSPPTRIDEQLRPGRDNRPTATADRLEAPEVSPDVAAARARIREIIGSTRRVVSASDTLKQ